MRALALDIGEVRIGIAASDATGRVASPVKVLPAAEVVSGARTWRRVLEDYEPDVLVCGRPKTLSGEDGPQAERVMEVARKVAADAGIPLEFCDERLSSAEAKRILREGFRLAAPGLPEDCDWILAGRSSLGGRRSADVRDELLRIDARLKQAKPEGRVS